MFWTPRQSRTPEWMDGDQYSDQDLHESLQDLRWINRYLGGNAVVIKNLSRLAKEKKLLRFSILDVATGSGDIPLEIAKWGRQKGLNISILGIDKNSKTIEIARENAKDYPEIKYETADFFELDSRKQSFDFCISSLFLHHLSPDQVPRFLEQMLLLSRHAVLINDLIRSWAAYGGYLFIAKCAGLHQMTRHDGAVSVLRAYTVPQLCGILKEQGLEKFLIRRHFPYRFCLILGR
jgi:2-polyprenyl-3-methyl-5-hydroxy-6-metoxy-1,4-benzoquinol methylase